MDIHKPKPFHNLREFASEVLIVVVGVAIALGGEQAVEWLTWQHRAQDAREAIAIELGEDIGQGEARVRVGACYAAELDRLAKTIDAAAASGRLPPIAAFRTPPLWTWDTDGWRNAQASGAAAHMRSDEQHDIGAGYSFIATLRDTNDAERDPWTRLSTLAGPGRGFGGEEAIVMRYALAQSRRLNSLMVLGGLRIRQAADIPHIRFDPEIAANMSASPDPRDPCAIAGASAALDGPVPPDYGGQFNAADIAALIARVKATGWVAFGRNAPKEAVHGHP